MLMNWLEACLLPCPSMHFFQLPCPGCGFQRALILLLHGHAWAACCMFPPLFPLLSLWGLAAWLRFRPSLKLQHALRGSFLLTVGLLVVNLLLKMKGI